ncbi:MAG: CerR family C-terminal domain-containing protein [Verrucomicrobia bacterium]|nr:CerR family C-terminal domain-containing protein [Verrucomicrobiota bacterium]
MAAAIAALLPARRRRPRSSPNADETRRRVVEAAGEVFAEHGFHAPTIRQITQRAGVNLAAVNYHFRDKDELYATVLHHAHRAAAACALTVNAARPPREQLRACVRGFLQHLLGPARPAWHGRLMAREMAQPTPALDSLVEESMRPRCETLAAILRALTGNRLPRAQHNRIGLSIVGQCLIYSQNRALIERLFPPAPAAANQVDALADHIAQFSLGGIAALLNQAKRRSQSPAITRRAPRRKLPAA